MMDSNQHSFMISGIQHFEFCPRQWALIHIEQAWEENVLTVEGNLLHSKVDDPFIREKRGDILFVRALKVHSTSLPIHGVCDMVEFHYDKNGITLYGEEGKYKVLPVEYKRGKPKRHQADILQTTAQVICLEEMFQTTIEEVAFYYHEIRHRDNIIITKEHREKVIKMIEQMKNYYARRHTPKVKTGKHCKQCSLNNICLPELLNKETAMSYVQRMLKE
ncbi:CRISPR-associated protein Cas4 [Ornithinibacillus sp. 4-3]|uniref:CRISPR-associated exonuclease Cas4 n=1 Tax=Ornithinibacillus sp. 4-3 TaxID=3231488 RepID=A0AB39HTF4_9BACI